MEKREKSPVSGVHHVTAITADPQRNFDFYTGVLGLRFVKKTVNFDDPSAYHLYYGNESGDPGTILTFFLWPMLPPGSLGTNIISRVAFTVPVDSIEFWKDHLNKHKVAFESFKHFGRDTIIFSDPDGLSVRLIASFEGEPKSWDGSSVPKDSQIQYIDGVEISVPEMSEKTSKSLSYLGFTEKREENGITRFGHEQKTGGIDISHLDKDKGSVGVGSIHHVAFRVEDDEAQAEVRQALISLGLNPTNVIDRFYFHSVYFMLPEGVLFEIATNPPGFTVDESKEKLGEKLCLHPDYEPHREEIENNLQPIDTSYGK